MEFKQKYGKSSKIVSSIKQINFVRYGTVLFLNVHQECSSYIIVVRREYDFLATVIAVTKTVMSLDNIFYLVE